MAGRKVNINSKTNYEMNGKKYMLVKENAMFSPEQMTGSGQISLMDQLSEIDTRIAELQKTPHTFHSDPSHGWLEVEAEDLKILGIWGEITSYSYKNCSKVYLEEDLDAVTYLKKVFPDGWDSPEYKQFLTLLHGEEHEEHSFIRNLSPYSP